MCMRVRAEDVLNILKCECEVRDFGQDLSGRLQIVLPLSWYGSPQ